MTAASLKFLGQMHPEGPWALTAVAKDKKKTETRTFYPRDHQEASAWLAEKIPTSNLYWHVNPVRGVVRKKASKTDIRGMRFLHVDIDPRDPPPSISDPKKWLSQEQDRCLKLLFQNRPKGVPQPTVVVFSGGGYQAFWKLSELVETHGKTELIESAERYNQQLEILFGGDHCHNIDRLMRLPGTYNYPDSKKRAKGRRKAAAEVTDQNFDLVYSLEDFTQAPTVSVAVGSGFAGKSIYPGCEVNVSANVRRLDDIDELAEWDVSDRYRIIAVQGYHPEQPKKGDNSRSAWVFDLCCGLVRASVPDDVIYSILTDPDFGISESILEKGGTRAHKYAIKQIQSAKEEAVDPVLRELNETYAVISNMGGKCRIVERLEDPALSRWRITKQSFEDFRNSKMNIQVKCGVDEKGNPKTMPQGKWWLQHPQRRQYKTLVFAPEKETPGSYNLWQGFAVEPRPGRCDILLDHIFRNICGSNNAHYNYLMNWMARAVQEPGSQGEVAVVLQGKRGVGKSILAKIFGKLWGAHYLAVSNGSHLVGNFNAHLRDCCFLFADEAFFAGDKKHISTLKTLITEDQILVEPKGVDAETAKNCLHIMMASNDAHVVPAGADERRFFVLEVDSGNHQDTAFFKRLLNQMSANQDEGYAAFLHELRTRDIRDFDVRSVPKTEALQEQKMLSLTPEQDWWHGKLEDGKILKFHDDWEETIIKEDLLRDYIGYTKMYQYKNIGNATRLGIFLAKMVPGLGTKQLRVARKEETPDGGYTIGESKRYNHYVFPSLERCRLAWEERFGPKQNGWDSSEPPEPDAGEVPF